MPRKRDTRATLEKLARAEPRTLACMHGSAWHGDGGMLLRALADALGSFLPRKGLAEMKKLLLEASEGE